ncbi:hypothetical protein [Streptomyces albidoflavus]|uniref:hypothetical protein n=1 Tax=Streptomyces albidoflavus TaxID=1886 RepID=UPI00188B272D|nr:hypothetical protein [Streptomyces albidoflavus]MBF4138141.1 hypothetical protein [Streptomyces albidoflavus]MBZ2410807.1 hypothetical protein [Streptomyces sp. L06]
MTKRNSVSDRPCIIPAYRAWLQEVGWVAEALGIVSAAAYVSQKHTGQAEAYGLPPLTYDIAASTLSDICETSVAAGSPPGSVQLVLVEGWELEALWSVVDVLRRSGDAPAGNEDLANLVRMYLWENEAHHPGALADLIKALERVLAVLTLDIPAAREIATALALRREVSPALQHAVAEVRDVWRAAGIRESEESDAS